MKALTAMIDFKSVALGVSGFPFLCKVATDCDLAPPAHRYLYAI